MRRPSRTLRNCIPVLPILLAALAAEASGTIAGRLTRAGGAGVQGASVNVDGHAAVTGPDGRFSVAGLEPGAHTVRFRLGDDEVTRSIEVADGTSVTLDETVDWPAALAQSITVYGASRRLESPVEAPASVSVIDEGQIAREAGHGQVPRLVQGLAGVDALQSGTHDFNVCVRGLNTAVSRRVLTLIDGRDPSIVLLGSQNWSGWARWLADDLQSIELIRGPNSALYGANAFNGVMSLTTRDPRSSPGGRARLTLGELETAAAQGRYAGAFGDDWSYRVNAGYSRSDDFARSRVTSVEYEPELLPREAVPLPLDRIESHSASGRLDRHFRGGSSVVMEGGYVSDSGLTVITPTGRTQVQDSKNPFARVAYQAPRWKLQASYDHTSGDSVAPASGATLVTDGDRFQTEAQGNLDFWGGRARLVGGGSYRHTKVDSADEHGLQTTLRDQEDSNEGALFGQLDLRLTDALKLVAAARVDESSLVDTQFSPKAGLVYALSSTQSVRVTYGKAFQSPNFVEHFLRTPAAPPVDLSALEAALGPLLGGRSLGLASVPVLALGNSSLEVEDVRSFEGGYRGTLGGKAVVTADYYRNRYQDFITDLLPQLGTGLGRVNPRFGAYQPPAGLDPAQAAALLGALQGALPPELFAILSNDEDGAPIFAAASYANFGEVRTQGIDLGLRYFVDRHFTVDASGSWFDFDLEEELAGSPIEPNAPRYKMSLGLALAFDRFDVSGRLRWVDSFRWAGGLLRGPVPSFTSLDLAASCRVASHVSLGADVQNLLDDGHWEIFGGDVLSRRAQASLVLTW